MLIITGIDATDAFMRASRLKYRTMEFDEDAIKRKREAEELAEKQLEKDKEIYDMSLRHRYLYIAGQLKMSMAEISRAVNREKKRRANDHIQSTG